MRLHELMDELPVQALPTADPEVRGVCHDSRRVEIGDLYVAIVGARHDGRRFSGQAVERGAVAVLGPGKPLEELPVPWIRVEDPRRLLGPIAARLYGDPHRDLLMVGVTGTNGKSTTVAILARILTAAGWPAGTLGTLGYSFSGAQHGSGVASPQTRRTTPEASDLFRILAEMRAAGARAAVMEVSSHALAMGRVEGARFDVGVFTNLTRDHLDFHRDLESYFAAKRRLFDMLKPNGKAVVAVVDEWGRRLASELPEPLRFGDGGDVWVDRAELTLVGIRGRIVTPRGPVAVRSRLLGRYNLENLLAAVAAAEALGVERGAIEEGIADQGPLPGRMEPVDAGQSFPAVVDFAHTPVALEAVLRSFRELSDRKLILVFGCGGERDTGKRPQMGEIAGRWVDLPIVTSDNPRREDPLAIMKEVEKGIRESGNDAYRLLPDRSEAIRRAVSIAAHAVDERWAVLVAGKGHEEVQVVGDDEIPFSDQDQLRAAIAGEVNHG